eukprot:gene19276-biopygen8452
MYTRPCAGGRDADTLARSATRRRFPFAASRISDAASPSPLLAFRIPFPSRSLSVQHVRTGGMACIRTSGRQSPPFVPARLPSGKTQAGRAAGHPTRHAYQGSRAPLGETATPASGPRPVRVRFFKFYRVPRVRSASGPRPLPFSPGVAVRHLAGTLWAVQPFRPHRIRTYSPLLLSARPFHCD